MNWFEPVFLNWLEQGWLVSALSNWQTRALFIAGILAGFVLLRQRMLSNRVMGAALVLGIVMDEIELPDIIASGLKHVSFIPERISMFSGEIVVILLGFLLGLGMVLASLNRRWRTRDRLTTGGALLVITTLLWGYHTLLINGWLMASLHAEAERCAGLIEVAQNTDDQQFMDICRSLQFDCATGPIQPTITHANPHIAHLANARLAVLKQAVTDPEQPFGFSISDGLATPETPFALAYYQRDGRYWQAVETRIARLNFDSARVSFFLIANIATAFWIMCAASVIILHRRRKQRHGKA